MLALVVAGLFLIVVDLFALFSEFLPRSALKLFRLDLGIGAQLRDPVFVLSDSEFDSVKLNEEHTDSSMVFRIEATEVFLIGRKIRFELGNTPFAHLDLPKVAGVLTLFW
jgi:hypothetical protein